MNISINTFAKVLICAALALAVTVFTTQSVVRSSGLRTPVKSMWAAVPSASASTRDS